MEKELVQKQLENKADELFGKSGELRDSVQDDIEITLDTYEDYLSEIDEDSLSDEELKDWFEEELENLIADASQELYDKELKYNQVEIAYKAAFDDYAGKDTSDITDKLSDAENEYRLVRSEYNAAEDKLNILKEIAASL